MNGIWMHTRNLKTRLFTMIKKEERHMKEIDWKRKLTSRKLWLSIASFVAMLIIAINGNEGSAQQISALIMAGATIIGYVIGEGLADSGNKEE